MDVFADLVAHLFLQSRKRRRQRRADRRATGKNEVDCDRLIFDQVSVEVQLVAILVQHRDVGNLHLCWFRFGFRR